LIELIINSIGSAVIEIW